MEVSNRYAFVFQLLSPAMVQGISFSPVHVYPNLNIPLMSWRQLKKRPQANRNLLMFPPAINYDKVSQYRVRLLCHHDPACR